MYRKTLPEYSIQQLVHLSGDFRPPLYRVRALQVVIVALMLFAILAISSLFERRHVLVPSVRLFVAAALSVGILPASYVGLKRTGQWYRFAAGRVQLCSAIGRVIWDEDLSAVVSATIAYGDGPQGFLELVWKHATRKIEITADLADAIRGLDETGETTE
jgi:hypothetical protein